MSLFNNVSFFTTVNHFKDLPHTTAEIAFVGRSNAGKSSAINTITNQTRLAFVSKTPGRTQHINFFELGHDCFIADLPGYGYAAVPAKVRSHWIQLLGEYLQKRESLVGLVIIMDIRHPLRDLDKQMLDFFVTRNRPIHILLSKSDKLSRNEQFKTLAKVKQDLQVWSEKIPISIQLFSSLKKQGVEEVENAIQPWLDVFIQND